MASEQSIYVAVRKAIEANPLPETVAELDKATLRFFEREATRRGMSVQALLDMARALQSEELGKADGQLRPDLKLVG